ncbi:MAG: hypothetical protein R3B40_29700 [Polyangiales bacterium]|nr:hypothetical protein [Sandaracinaceae bacterium]
MAIAAVTMYARRHVSWCAVGCALFVGAGCATPSTASSGTTSPEPPRAPTPLEEPTEAPVANAPPPADSTTDAPDDAWLDDLRAWLVQHPSLRWVSRTSLGEGYSRTRYRFDDHSLVCVARFEADGDDDAFDEPTPREEVPPRVCWRVEGDVEHMWSRFVEPRPGATDVDQANGVGQVEISFGPIRGRVERWLLRVPEYTLGALPSRPYREEPGPNAGRPTWFPVGQPPPHAEAVPEQATRARRWRPVERVVLETDPFETLDVWVPPEVPEGLSVISVARGERSSVCARVEGAWRCGEAMHRGLYPDVTLTWDDPRQVRAWPSTGRPRFLVMEREFFLWDGSGSGSGGMGDSQLEVYAVEPERLRLHATIHTGALRFVNDFIGESYTHALYTLRYWHASELVGARCIRMGPLVREQVALDFTFFPLAEQPAPVRSLERALPIVASSDGSIEADRTSIDDVDIVNGARLPVLRTTGVYVLTAEGVELMARDVVDVDAACASAP